MDVDLPPMEEGQPADAEAEAEAKPGPDVEVEADSQMQALASLKELCDSGLLPMNLYQENVAAIHRSSRRLQQWRERLREKSHQVLERHAAMQEHEGGLLATMDGMHGAADRVKLLVQQQMNDLRKAIDAKEQALLDDLQDNRLERTREMEWHVQRNCTKDPH